MARLTRKNIKVFAENATNNGIFGSLQANDPTTTNDVEQIQSLPAWSNGWDDATMTSEDLPPLEEFQGIQYVVSYEQAYLMQEGLPEWSTTVTYYKGSLVKKVTTTGFQIYNSLTDNNTGNMLSDTNNWKLVMDSDNLYALDNTVVHKTGDETISGVKTFAGTGDITYIQNTSVTYNTAPLSDTFTTVAFIDKNSENMGVVECKRATDNATIIQFKAYGANGSWGADTLRLKVAEDGKTTASAPTPTYTTSNTSNEIATIGWVNNTGNNVVHLNSNETISGTKTFTGGINVNTGNMYFKEGGVYNNGQPSTTQRFATTHYMDSANVLRGYTHNYQNTNGDVITELRATNTVYGSSLLVGVSQSGVRYVQAPASDVVDSVVTTINKSKSENGYFKLGNGLIIQWGHSSIDGNQVTLPTPFSNTNYRICATYMRSSGNIGSGSGHLCTYPTSTTSFYANTEAGEYQWIAIGY